MRRRAFVALACGTLAWPGCDLAQTVKRVARLCFLTFDPGTPQLPAKRFEAFFERLRELGSTNGEWRGLATRRPCS
jgi:putative ABC transport system substrate-binding protein